jgi:hypothetical protein
MFLLNSWRFGGVAAMPPSYVGALTYSGGATNSWNIPIASPAVNDLVIVVIFQFGGAPTIATPAGWTKVIEQNTSNNGGILVFRKVASGSEGANQNFTSGLNTDIAWRVYKFNDLNYNTTTPVQATGQGGNATISSMPTPSLTSSLGFRLHWWASFSMNRQGIAVNAYPYAEDNANLNSGGVRGAGAASKSALQTTQAASSFGMPTSQFTQYQTVTIAVGAP